MLIRNNYGFTIPELIVGIAVVVVISLGIIKIAERSISTRDAVEAMTQVKKIEKALEVVYRENIELTEERALNEGKTSYHILTPTPFYASGNEIDPQRLRLYVPYLPDTWKAGGAWFSAGCSIKGPATSYTGNPYSVSCTTPYGTDVEFVDMENYQTTVSDQYPNGYTTTPYSVTIRVKDENGNVVLEKKWTTAELDREYLQKTVQKFQDIAEAMKTYHLQRLFEEANTNPCTPGVGGLSSNDDMLIPWIWQIFGADNGNEHVKCKGIESGSCGCDLFDGNPWVWIHPFHTTTGPKTNAIYSLMRGTTLDRSHMVDGYGNNIIVWLLVDGNGDPPAENPPSPRVNYADCLPGGSGSGCGMYGTPDFVWSLMPPYQGRILVRRNSTDIMYSMIVKYDTWTK